MGINIKVKIKHGNPQVNFIFTIDENNVLIPLNPENRIFDATNFNHILNGVLSIKGLMERANISKVEIEEE